MKNYLLILLAVAFIATSCENTNKKNTEKKAEEVVVVDQITPVLVAEFDDKAGDFVGKKIKLEGTVDHICKHGGQRLFLVSPESGARIKVTPDEEIAAFNADLEGSNIILIGIVEEQRVDEDYLQEWEAEIKSGADMADGKGEGSHLGGTMEKGGEGADISEEMEKVNNLREMIKESGKDYISFFSVLCTDYDVVENNDGDEKDHSNEEGDGHNH